MSAEKTKHDFQRLVEAADANDSYLDSAEATGGRLAEFIDPRAMYEFTILMTRQNLPDVAEDEPIFGQMAGALMAGFMLGAAVERSGDVVFAPGRAGYL